jgi:hypothetical protein
MDAQEIHFRGQQRAYYDFSDPDIGKRMVRDQQLFNAAIAMVAAKPCCKSETKCSCAVKPVEKASTFDPSSATYRLSAVLRYDDFAQQ